MKKLFPFFLPALLLPLWLSALPPAFAADPVPSATIQVIDDIGQTISLPHPARRIIPLYGAFAEILFALGAGGSVIARTQADQYPPEIAGLPSVGTHMRPNVEMILGLKPDLVIQSASRREETPEMDRLREAGIPVAVFSPKTFEGIFSTMLRLGVLAGREEPARSAVAVLEERLKKVKESRDVPEKKPPRVFFEVRGEPLTAAGRGSIIQEILTVAGAENVLRSDKALVQYNFEALLADDPDFYIVQKGPMNRNPSEPAKRAHFDQLRAVRQGRVIVVDELLFSRPGPRCVDAVERMAEALRGASRP